MTPDREYLLTLLLAALTDGQDEDSWPVGWAHALAVDAVPGPSGEVEVEDHEAYCIACRLTRNMAESCIAALRLYFQSVKPADSSSSVKTEQITADSEIPF